MREKPIKLIMELIFIFILPLVFICFTSEIQVERQFTYDNNGNYETSQDTKQLSFDNSIIKYTKQENIIEYTQINQTYIYEQGGLTCGDTLVMYIQDNELDTGSIGWGDNNIIEDNIDVYIFTKSNGDDIAILNLYFYDERDEPYEIDIEFEGTYYSINYNNQYYYINCYLVEELTDINLKNYLKNYNYYSYYNLKELRDELIRIEPDIIPEYDTYEEYNFNDNNFLIVGYENKTITKNTIWGNIKELLITNLDLNDNVLLDIVLCYTILWIIMFLLWHLIYGLLELFFHIIPRPLKEVTRC